MGPRRPVDELITMYELEPSLREVIVEGRVDASLIIWFFSAMGIGVPVNALRDRVDIPRDTLEKFELDVGERGRVVAAATIINQSPKARDALTFVVDADFDHIFGPTVPAIDCLLMTDYTAIDLYCCTTGVIEKFIRVALRSTDDIDGSVIIQSIKSALIALFSIRWVLKNTDGSPSIISKIERRCRDDQGRLVIDTESVLRDSINSNSWTPGGVPNVQELMKEVESLTNALAEKEIRYVAHGHDFVALVALLIRKRYNNLLKEDRSAFKNRETVGAALRLCLQANDLQEEHLFEQLLSRVGAGSN